MARAVYYRNTTSPQSALVSTSRGVVTFSSHKLSFNSIDLEGYYTGYTDVSLRSYCLTQYSFWWNASNPGTVTTTRTQFEGFGPTDSYGGVIDVTTQTIWKEVYTYTENLPSDYPGHASPPCVRSPVSHNHHIEAEG